MWQQGVRRPTAVRVAFGGIPRHKVDAFVSGLIMTSMQSGTNTATVAGSSGAKRPASDNSPRYIVDKAVAPGLTQEVAPGVHWLRMPLPFPALDHINLWLLDEGDDFVIVDTGMGDDQTKDIWNQVFNGPMAGRHANRVICTHYHNDHAGLVGWLTERFNVELWMSQGEFYASHSVYSEVASHQPSRMYDMYRANGLSDTILEQMLERRNSYRVNVRHFPPSFRRLLDGDTVRVGRNDWKIIAGYGHSPEHSALYCEELGVLIAGDMVLPRITTNVSVQATEPNGNPLDLWFRSLERHAQLPPETLVLPSHGLPFRGLRDRLAFIRKHHEERLEELVAFCSTPKTTAQVLPTLFHRELDVHQTGIAMGEALAHLHYLMYEGRLRREVDREGFIRFVAA
jgi:glyoxylase-like metal-dependent hydrolase (beta-lactamase superfamily II)